MVEWVLDETWKLDPRWVFHKKNYWKGVISKRKRDWLWWAMTPTMTTGREHTLSAEGTAENLEQAQRLAEATIKILIAEMKSQPLRQAGKEGRRKQ